MSINSLKIGLCAVGGTLIAPLAMEDIKKRRNAANAPIEQQQPAESGDNTKEIEIAQMKSMENPVENNNA